MINKRTLDGDIEDVYTRESMTRLNQYLASSPFIKGEFSFFIFTFTNPTGAPVTLTDAPLPHGLKFTPKDVLQTSFIGTSLTWNYAKFNDVDLFVTVTIAANSTATVRAFIGRYEEESISG